MNAIQIEFLNRLGAVVDALEILATHKLSGPGYRGLIEQTFSIAFDTIDNVS